MNAAHDTTVLALPALDVMTVAPVIDFVIPVFNEELDLARNVRRLHAYLVHEFPFSARITIADNASTDGTWFIARQLARDIPNVRPLHINEKGRGRALASAWLTSDARVVAYMDVDLSTDISGHSDVCIGSRLARGARVVRGVKRELISRCYNLLLRVSLGVTFRDAQCGFKSMRADVAHRLLPQVKNRNWFFDTELLVVAERAGLRIHELPVAWADDPSSSVDIVATAMEDLRGIWRLATGRFRETPPRLAGQLARFAAVGIASTLAYAGLFWLLRGALPATSSNSLVMYGRRLLLKLFRRLEVGINPDFEVGRFLTEQEHAIALGLTNAAIVLLSTFAPAASPRIEIGVLTAVNAIATGARFLILRALLFHSRRRAERAL